MEKTFLVINLSCFGDILLTNSLCQNIKILYPNSKVIFCVDKPFEEVAKYQKDVDEVMVFDKRGKDKGLINLAKYAFRSKDIGRCYRNLGWYFVEKKMYKEAIGVYIMSTHYDRDSNTAQGELYYIQQMDASAKEPTIDELNAIAEKNGFPMGPDKTVLQTAYAYGKHFMDKKMIDAARYCFEILYDLTGDEEIKELLEKIPGEE